MYLKWLQVLIDAKGQKNFFGTGTLRKNNAYYTNAL